MSEAEVTRVLVSLSNELAEAVATSAASVVRVNARRRIPSSGIVWSDDGLIVTANHTVERDEDLTVGLADGTELPARLIGREPGADIALLQIAAGRAKAATLAPAESVRVGHLSLAVARPSAGPPQATMGIISALGEGWRSRRVGLFEGFIRADVSFNPGFSGGALADVHGRVIGMNTSGFGNVGITIPAAAVGRMVEALRSGTRLKRAFLGVTSQAVVLPKTLVERAGLSQETGLMVMAVEENSPAGRGGLLVGDILVMLGDKPLRDIEDLQLALIGDLIGRPTPLRIIRGGQATTLTVTPVERT